MPVTVTREDILSVKADAAVMSVEIALNVSDGASCRRIDEAGGEALRASIRKQRFLPVGSSAVAEAGELPFRHVLFTAAPRWLTGKANEFYALHRCYESLFALASGLGCRSVVSPFLSAWYYRFPRDEAVRIALAEAEKWDGETIFVADTDELYELSQRPWRKPKIVSYVGWYRDHGVFLLDNGLYARVDLRRERTDVSVVPYIEACFRKETDPLQVPLSEEEIERLRRIYEENDW